MTRYEQETIILFNEEENTAEVYTHNGKMIRTLDKFCKEFPDNFKEIMKDEKSKTYIVPKQNISVRKPLSKATKAKLSQNLKPSKTGANYPHKNSALVITPENEDSSKYSPKLETFKPKIANQNDYEKKGGESMKLASLIYRCEKCGKSRYGIHEIPKAGAKQHTFNVKCVCCGSDVPLDFDGTYVRPHGFKTAANA